MQTNNERYLTYEQAADLLCMTAQGLRNMFSQGAPPPSIKVGRRRLFPESEVYKWLSEKGQNFTSEI